MPREIWSIEVRALVDKALADLRIIESALQQLSKKGTFQVRANVQTKAAVDNLNQVGSAATAAANKSRTFVDQLRADFNNFGTIFAKRLAFTFATTVERFILGAIRAIPAAFASAIRTGAEFESAIRKTATVAVAGTGDIEAAMMDLGSTAREVGAQTTFTASEIANGMFELVSAGLSVEQVNAAIRSSTEFAIAVQTDLGTAIDLTTQIMKSFGLRSQDLADVADIMTGAINRSTLTVSRLQAAMRFAAPAAGAIGLSVADTVAVLGEFVNVTKQGGIAGRAFRFAVQSLLAPQEKATKRMKELGVQVTDTSGRLRGIIDILTDFAKSGMDPATDAVLIFGKRAGPVIASAIKNIRRSLAEGRNSLQEFRDALLDDAAQDRAAAQAAEFLNTLQSQFTLTGAKLEELSLILFSQIGGIVTIVVRGFNAFLDVLIAVGSTANDLRPILLGLAAALAINRAGGLGAVVGSVIGVFTNFQRILAIAAINITKLANLFGFTSVSAVGLTKRLTAMASRVGLLINPWVLFIGLLTAAATKSTALRKVLGDLTGALSSIRILGFTVGEIFVGALEKIASFFTFIFESIVQFIDLSVQFAIDRLIDFLVEFRGLLEKLPDRLVPDSLIENLANAERNLRDYSAELSRTVRQQERFKQESEAAADKFTDFQDVLVKQIETIPDLNRAVELIESTYNNFVESGVDAADAADFVSDALKLAQAAADRLGVSLDSPGLVEIMAQLALSTAEVDEEFRKLANDGFAALGVSTKSAEEDFKSMQAVMQEVLANENLSDEFKALVAVRIVDTVIEMRREMVEELGELPPEIALVFDEMLAEAREFREEFPISVGVRDSILRAATSGKIPEAMTQITNRIKESLRMQLADPKFQEEVNKGFEELFERIGTEVDAEFEVSLPGSARESLFQQLRAGSDDIDDFINDITKSLSRGLADMIVQGRSFTDIFSGVLRAGFTNVIGNITSVFSDAFKAANVEGGFFSSLQFGFEKVFDTIGNRQTAMLSGAAAAFGGWAEVGVSAMSSVANFAKGDLVGGFVAAGGAIIGAIRNLFGGESELEKVAKDIGRTLGVEISEELAEEIAARSDELGNRFAAITLSLPKIIEEAGDLTAKSLNQFVLRTRQAFSAFDQGAASGAEAVNVIIDSFKLLIPEINEVGGDMSLVTKTMEDLTDRVRQGMIKATDAVRAFGEILPLVLEEVLEAGGAGFDQLIGQISLVFEGLRDGFFNTGQAAQLLDPIISGVIDNLDMFGVAGSIALRTITEAARAAGVEIASLNEFIRTKSEEIIAGISQFVDASVRPILDRIKDLREEGEDLAGAFEGMPTLEEFRLIGSALSTAFFEMLKSGASVVEIIDLMGDDVTALRDLMVEAFGDEIPAEIQKLFGFFNKLAREEVQEVIRSIDGLGQAVGALGELGLLTAEDFATFQGSVATAFDELIGQGLTSEQALAALAPQLQLLNDLSNEYGFTLDENTQLLIDQAEEQGVVQESSMSMNELLTAGFQGVIDALNEVIRQMGGIPVEFDIIGGASDETTDEVVENWRRVRDEGERAFDDVRRGARDAFREMAMEAGESALASIDHFSDLEMHLVGNSVFPDSAEGALDAYDRMVKGAAMSAAGIASLFDDSLGSSFGLRLPTDISTSLVLPSAPRPAADRSNSSIESLLQRIARGIEQEKQTSLKVGEREFGSIVSRTARQRSLDGRIELEQGSVTEIQSG